MSESNDLKELANAADHVLGSDAAIHEHHCRNGTWFFVGAVATMICANLTSIGSGWTAGLALGVGWWINEKEATRLRARFAEQRSADE